MRPRRRGRERDRPAARAQKARQRPLGHLPDDLRVDDLRPPVSRGLRAVQGRPAVTALRRRRRGPSSRPVRIPCQAFPLMTGLPAPLAVLPALPLRLLPRPPRLLRPDPLPRLGVPESVLSIPSRRSSSASRSPSRRRSSRSASSSARSTRVLRVLRLHHGPQPGVRSTKPRSVISQGLTGHAPQAPTATASRQIDKRRSRLCHGPRLKAQATARTDITLRPREWTPERSPLAGPSFQR